MAIAWGRDATITVNGVAVAGTQDIATTDETEVRRLNPRLDGGVTRLPGRQLETCSFDILVSSSSYAGLVALRNSRASFPLVVANGTDTTSFVGVIEKIDKSHPMNGGPSVASVSIVQSE
jgi:hypothetical protein